MGGSESTAEMQLVNSTASVFWLGLVGFMAYQPFVGYLKPNPFLCK